jgi:taurine--2-oxoglutarate transaminase
LAAAGGSRPCDIREGKPLSFVGHGWKQYLDFASGQINVNVGYGHPRVLAAMRAQMERTTYLAPAFPSEARIRLASMVASHMPGELKYVFFTNSGSEAIENAMKVARAVSGRQKIYSAWQSYHGATAGAAAISGDPRRMYVEPSMPGLGKFHYANCYRCPFGQVAPPQCHFACLHSLRSQIIHDGPESVAAIVLEPISGTSGIYVPPQQYVQGVRALCDEYGILLILDETMSGWGELDAGLHASISMWHLTFSSRQRASRPDMSRSARRC